MKTYLERVRDGQIADVILEWSGKAPITAAALACDVGFELGRAGEESLAEQLLSMLDESSFSGQMKGAGS